jgi:hypothetical protein
MHAMPFVPGREGHHGRREVVRPSKAREGNAGDDECLRDTL